MYTTGAPIALASEGGGDRSIRFSVVATEALSLSIDQLECAMRVHPLRRSVLLLALTLLVGCDSGEPDAPDIYSLVGSYKLVQYGGAPLPNGNVTGGRLVLRIEQTIPSYHAEWVHNGAAVTSDGLYSVTGNTIGFFGTIQNKTFDHSGVIEGDQITVAVNDGVFTTFTFERE